MVKTASNRKIIPLLITFVFFAVLLFIGLRIYDDYGPVSEERNQIDAGHIIWAHITGDNSHYPELPALEDYMNRYYGQGATFITVLLEAAFGFTWDINRVWKVRRLWNFFCFFSALVCMFGLVKRRYKSYPLAFLVVLNLILLPRMFPEVFYNDRDPLFLSWLIFSFCAMMLFLRKTNLLTSVLFGIALAFTVSVRMFGFMLLIPLILIFVKYPGKRRWLIPVILVFVLVWYGISPIAWKDPFGVLKTSIVHLTTKQRALDTLGTTSLLFNGKYYPEQELPWFYLPLWMLISTPLVLLFLFAAGGVIFLKHGVLGKENAYSIIDISLGTFFLLFIIGIPIIRPTLYSGWRHFYFLNLSLVWFAVYFLDFILRSKNRWLKYTVFFIESVSLVITLFAMVKAHPYEGIYYNSAFRTYAPDRFERDMGFTSTLECLEYLAQNAPDEKIEVMNANAFIHFSLIGLPEPVRERFSTIDWKMQRIPMKYIIFNYNNQQGNDYNFPYYAPIYSIERNGTKLAEIFQRTNNNLLDPADIVESIHTTYRDETAPLMLTEDPNEIWTGEEPHDPTEVITLKLKDGIEISSLEVFPGDYTETSEELKFFTSADGNSEWKELSAVRLGTNGWLFQIKPCRYLQIKSIAELNQPWQIRQILFYGKSVFY